MNATITVIGQGRMGNALAGALDAGQPAGRGPLPDPARNAALGAHDAAPAAHDAASAALGAPPAGNGQAAVTEIVLLCVPDDEIARAATAVAPAPGRLVGHCSGATTLEPLSPHEAFSLHPLMTVTERGVDFDGARCAVAGSTPRALAVAHELAARLGMVAVMVDDGDRAAYHAAASIASNFLVTLEAAAERLLATAGADRDLLVPLVRATVESWAAQGPERALTGPIARGDEATVARQRAAVQERTPDLLPLFDTLAEATRALAGREVAA
jgi:predicted short-subunit dehydrogenase-like oxidoreductase (DUF2520 family)